MLHKPRGVVSQFVSPHAVRLLGQLGYDFPAGTHAIGRLDQDSEGLLLLTTNKSVTRLLFSAIRPHTRTYLVQVNGILQQEKVDRLAAGVSIRIDGGQWYQTPPCTSHAVPDPSLLLPSYVVDDRYGPHSWVAITLTEGKYHQVRKMIGSLHHRCKRLIRTSIEDLHLGALPPGDVHELSEAEFFAKLHL